MRAISLWQPWASAVAIGSKRIETRGWSTKYRGPLAIHAAKRFNVNEMIHHKCCWNWCGALAPLGWNMGDNRPVEELLPFGAIVGVCELVDVRSTGSFRLEEIEWPRRPENAKPGMYDWTERQLGDFELGRFGWVLANPRALPAPIPFKGAQGFFNVPDELLAMPA